MMKLIQAQAGLTGAALFFGGWVALLLLASLEAALVTTSDSPGSLDQARRSGPLLASLHDRPRNVAVSFAICRECAMVVCASGAVLAGLQVAGVIGGVVFLALACAASAVALPWAALLAARNNERASKLLQPIVAPCVSLAGRVANYVAHLGRSVYFILRREPPPGESILAHDEIATLTTREALEDLEGPERTLLSKLITFNDLQVGRIMTPRVDVFALPLDIGPEELRQEALLSRFSRIPVYRGERENIAGILYVKDLIGRTFGKGELEGLLRKPYFVPVTKTAGELFREFRRARVHMAVVVDEYGGMAGVVTMEDLLEELFGEIHDEFDEREEHIERQAPGVYRVSGRLSLIDLASKLNLPVAQGAHENTVGGLIVSRLGHLPERGETLRMDGFSLTVEEVQDHAIERVKVELWPLVSS